MDAPLEVGEYVVFEYPTEALEPIDVSEEVIEGAEDIAHGDTASKEDLRELLYSWNIPFEGGLRESYIALLSDTHYRLVVAAIPLSDNENVAIFSQQSFSALHNLDKDELEQFIGRVLTLLDSTTPKRYIEKKYSNCEELEQLRAGGYLRGLCRLIMDVHGYNILFLFHVSKHKYRQLRLYDEQACDTVKEVTNMESIENVESYLDERNAMTAEDIKEILEKPP